MKPRLKNLPAQTRSDLLARTKARVDANRWHSAAIAIDYNEPTALFVRGSDSVLSSTGRLDLLKQLRAGDVVELEMEIVAFIQRDTPNRNFSRFKPGMMPTFAKTFAGRPFLRNHGQDEQQDRGGTILTSKLEHNDDGTKQIRQRLRLVKQWAVESALDGTLDQFSIGWHRMAPSECSLCGVAWVDASCVHWPGDTDAKTGQVCELVTVAADGTETSYVNVPAVLGTFVESISQLEAIDPGLLADMLAAHTSSGGPDIMTLAARLAALLVLTATATDDDIVTAIETQRDQLATTRDQLTVATSAATNVKDRLATLESESAERTRTARVATVEGGVQKLIAAGKIKPGSETEASLRRLGGVTKTSDGKLAVDEKRPLDLFESSVSDLLATGPTVTPVGAPLPAIVPDPAPTAPSDAKAYLAEQPAAKSMLAAAGADVLAHFEKHGAQTGALASAKFRG